MSIYRGYSVNRDLQQGGWKVIRVGGDRTWHGSREPKGKIVMHTASEHDALDWVDQQYKKEAQAS